MSQDPQQPHGQDPNRGSSPGYGQPYPSAPGSGSPYPSPGQGYGGPQQPAKNGLGIAALVLGILSIPLAVFFFPLGVILGVLAIIFGVIGMGRAKKGRATNRGVAIAGLVSGIIGTAIAAIFIVLFVGAFSDCSDLATDGNSDAFSNCITEELGG